MSACFAPQVLIGGKKPELSGPLAQGFFYEPTVLTDATIDMWVGLLGVGRITGRGMGGNWGEGRVGFEKAGCACGASLGGVFRGWEGAVDGSPWASVGLLPRPWLPAVGSSAGVGLLAPGDYGKTCVQPLCHRISEYI